MQTMVKILMDILESDFKLFPEFVVGIALKIKNKIVKSFFGLIGGLRDDILRALGDIGNEFIFLNKVHYVGGKFFVL